MYHIVSYREHVEFPNFSSAAVLSRCEFSSHRSTRRGVNEALEVSRDMKALNNSVFYIVLNVSANMAVRGTKCIGLLYRPVLLITSQ